MVITGIAVTAAPPIDPPIAIAPRTIIDPPMLTPGGVGVDGGNGTQRSRGQTRLLAALQTVKGSAAIKLEPIAMLKAAGLLIFEAPEVIEDAETALRVVHKIGVSLSQSDQ